MVFVWEYELEEVGGVANVGIFVLSRRELDFTHDGDLVRCVDFCGAD